MLLKLSKYFLFLNLFFLQSYLLRFQIASYPTNLQELLIIANVLIFFVYIIKEKHLTTILNNFRKYRVLILFILLSAISLLTVETKDYIFLIRYLKFLFFSSALIWLFLEILHDEQSRKMGIKIAGLGALTFGIFSIIFNLLGYNVAHDYRLTGPLDAAVYLAFYFAPFVIFFFTEFLNNPKQKQNLLFTCALTILLLLTRSMGSIAVTFLIMLFVTYKNFNFKILHRTGTKIIIAVLAIILFSTVFYSKILPAFETNYSSLNERGEIWQTSIALLRDPAVILGGLGLNQFQYHYENDVKIVLGREPLDYIVLQPHNIFFFFIFNFGILGIIVLLALIIKVVSNILKSHETNLRVTASFIALYFLLHGLIDTPFMKNDLLFILILALQLSQNSHPSADKQS